MSSKRIHTGPEFLWIVAAFCWGALSLLIIQEYRKLGGQPQQIHELWLVMSLLWTQFGFAAIFADWRRNRARRFRVLLLRALIPPLLLHFVIFGLL